MTIFWWHSTQVNAGRVSGSGWRTITAFLSLAAAAADTQP